MCVCGGGGGGGGRVREVYQLVVVLLLDRSLVELLTVECLPQWTGRVVKCAACPCAGSSASHRVFSASGVTSV